MTEVETSLNRQRWRLIQWPLMWTLALVSFVLGLVGFAVLPKETLVSPGDLIYNTLQLFVLNGVFSGPVNWQLEIARFLAPGVMAYTATQALILLFREQLTLLRLRFTRGHVVVCGLGRTGFKVTADCRRRGEQVVIIEEDDENDWISRSEDLGATVLIGDATNVQLLRQARIEQARLLVAVCGNDGVNVEVAIRSCAIKQASPPDVGPNLGCHIHIVESDLRALFKEHHLLTDTGDRCCVMLFNVYDASARLLLRRYPLDREHVGPDDPHTVHFVVIGFGQMGESLVLQAARNSHFANGRRLRVTVVDRDPVLQQQSFLRRHPRLDDVCDITFLKRDANHTETLVAVAALCSEPDTLPTVAICFDDDTRGLSVTLALLPKIRHLQVPILLRMTTEGGLTTLLDDGIASSRLAGLVKPFPVIGLSSDGEVLLNRNLDMGAIAIHDDYVARRRQSGHEANDPALNSWERLDEDLKDSNRQQADHIDVKLRAIGLTASADKTGPSINLFTPEEIEILSRMEHHRWQAERLLAGWTYAPGTKHLQNKTSPWLVAWDALPDEIREYTRESVRHIPHLVQLSGRRIVRNTSGSTDETGIPKHLR